MGFVSRQTNIHIHPETRQQKNNNAVGCGAAYMISTPG
jgi:hypothetical protein